MADEVVDNTGEHRFELALEGEVAAAYYQMDNGRMVFVHTEVPQRFSGRGIGSRLAKGALDAARERGVRVILKCPFMASYASRHPEYADLIDG